MGRWRGQEGLLYLVLEGHGDLGGSLTVSPAGARGLPLVGLPEPLGASWLIGGNWKFPVKKSLSCIFFVNFSCLTIINMFLFRSDLASEWCTTERVSGSENSDRKKCLGFTECGEGQRMIGAASVITLANCYYRGECVITLVSV